MIPIEKVKRQTTRWEKIFDIYISNKELTPNIDKGVLQLNKNTGNAIKNGPTI